MSIGFLCLRREAMEDAGLVLDLDDFLDWLRRFLTTDDDEDTRYLDGLRGAAVSLVRPGIVVESTDGAGVSPAEIDCTTSDSSARVEPC